MEELGVFPNCKSGSRVLVFGASGGIGVALLKLLAKSQAGVVGAHFATQLPAEVPGLNRCFPIQRELSSEIDCEYVFNEFLSLAGGVDIVVNLVGGIHFSGHWMEMPAEMYMADVNVNLNLAFFISRLAMRNMKKTNSWGRIILTGTESALHGGSTMSFPYAIAKRGTECLVQGLAREGASHNILVNGVRLGFIKSGFHERWHDRTKSDMEKRADLVPLKRGGETWEAAGLLMYLMSDWSGYITGQMLPITGGDWL